MKRPLRSFRCSRADYQRNARRDDLRFGAVICGTRIPRCDDGGSITSRAGCSRSARNSMELRRRCDARRAGAIAAVSRRYGRRLNENSIVNMLRYRAFRELFMGDAGEASEARLLTLCHPEQRRGAASDVPCNDLAADAIKVGHHGSRYASTPAFAAAVRPRFAIISVGRHNTFGHPSPTTIETWSAIRSEVLRTDRCGAIFLIDGAATTWLRCTAP